MNDSLLTQALDIFKEKGKTTPKRIYDLANLSKNDAGAMSELDAQLQIISQVKEELLGSGFLAGNNKSLLIRIW